MKNILIIGSTGQIGSELTMKLRGIYTGNVVAGYIPGAEPKGELLESGPSEIVDITNAAQIGAVVDKYNIGVPLPRTSPNWPGTSASTA